MTISFGSYGISGGYCSSPTIDVTDFGSMGQSGGTISAGSLYVTVGTYWMTDGQLTVTTQITVGRYSTGGLFHQSGGSVTTDTLYIAPENGILGNYELSGSGSVTTGAIYIGARSTTGTAFQGTFNHDGGANHVISLKMGNYGGYGEYYLEDGLLELGSVAEIGAGDTQGDQESQSYFEQSGGLFTDTPSGQPSNNADLHIGKESDGNGYYNMMNGNLVMSSVHVGHYGTGQMDISLCDQGDDATAYANMNSLTIGYHSGSSGEVNIWGGKVQAGTVQVGTYGSASLNIYAGTLGSGAPNLLLKDSDADAGTLVLSANGTYLASGSVILHFAGANSYLDIQSASYSNMSGLQSTTVQFVTEDDEDENIKWIEGCGVDLDSDGLDEDDFCAANFLIDTLIIGRNANEIASDSSAASGPITIKVLDNTDNQSGSNDPEDLYVDTLEMHAGATYDPYGEYARAIYYLNGGDPKQLFLGDANLDGCVDAADLAIFNTNYEMTGAVWADADFNGDRVVDDLDEDILQEFWGSGLGMGMAPEPATLLLLGAGAAGLLRRRRR